MRRCPSVNCLWCRESVESYDPAMHRFCDRCLANIETLGIDLDEAERKLIPETIITQVEPKR